MRKTIARLRALRPHHDAEAGQGLAEYALILTFVALVCVLALQQLGVSIANSPGFSQLPNVL